jgi:hypothetical protein
LDALVKADPAKHISLGGAFGLFHYLDYRSTHDVDLSRARLAIETHLERIALHRPLENIADEDQREQARQVRDWFASVFLRVNHG